MKRQTWTCSVRPVSLATFIELHNQQVQDFKPSVAHLYPNTGRVPSLHFHDSSTSEIPSLFILQHGLT